MKKSPVNKSNVLKPESWWWLISVVFTTLAYSSVTRLGFLSWDDNVYIYENPLIKDLSFAGIRQIFSNLVMGNYHPLVILTYALEYSFVKANPWLYHLDNLLLHLAATVLAGRYAYLMTKSNLAALVVSLLFGLHPLHVESVAWATERKDVLYGFFFLAGLLTWLNFRKTNTLKWAIFTWLLFIAACLSKGQAVMFAPMIILTDIFQGKKIKTLLRDPWIWVMLATALGFGLLAIYAQKQGGNIKETEAHTALYQLLMGFWSLLFYWGKAIFPFNLSPFYPYPKEPIPLYMYAGPVFVGIGIFCIWKCWNKYPWLAMGGVCYFLQVLPVAQFLPVGNAIAADRYFYLPALGVGFIAYQGVLLLPIHWARTLILGLAAGWGILTWQQVKIWKSTETFFQHIIDINPNVDFAFVNLGRYYEKQGNRRQAINTFLEGIRNNPTSPDSYNDGGYNYTHLQMPDSAILLLEEAIRLAPDLAEPHNNLGYAYNLKGNVQKSEYHLLKSRDLNPKNPTVYNNLGSLYGMMGKYDASVLQYKEAVRLNPDYADAYNNLGSSFGLLGKSDSALYYFNKAVTLDPKLPSAWFNYGIAWHQRGDTVTAFQAYRKAASLGHGPAQQFLKSRGENW